MYLQCHRPTGNLFCTAAMVREGCILPRTVLQRPVLGHCTAAHIASLHRCTGIDTSLLVFFFAHQQWSERDAFCQEQCCSALCWVIAQLYEQQIFIGVFALSQAYWQSVLHSSTGQRGVHSAKNSVAAPCVGSLHSCMNSKSS